MKTTHFKQYGLFFIIPVVLLAAIIIMCRCLLKGKLNSLWYFMEIWIFNTASVLVFEINIKCNEAIRGKPLPYYDIQAFFFNRKSLLLVRFYWLNTHTWTGF